MGNDIPARMVRLRCSGSGSRQPPSASINPISTDRITGFSSTGRNIGSSFGRFPALESRAV